MTPRTPLTVVHLITELNTGGAEQMLYKVITRMNRERFRSIVITMTERGPVGKKIAAEGFPVIELGMKLGRPRLSGAWKLFRLLKQERADILQTWLYHADLLGTIAGKMASVPRIVWGIRCSEMELGNYRLLTTLTVRACSLISSWPDAIIVNSMEGMKAHIGFGYHSKKMTIIPNGFDPDIFRPNPEARSSVLAELGLDPETLLIGLIARHDPMKDHSTFFRAASLLSANRKDIHFVLAGKGMFPGNAEIMNSLDGDLSGRVHLLGPREDISRITAALDIAASSSAYGEGFSNTVGEAMACGVPCVVTDVGDSAHIVGDTGIVVPPRDPDALTRAWSRLLDMGEDQRKELGERARSRIVEEFSMESVARRFEEIYERIRQGD